MAKELPELVDGVIELDRRETSRLLTAFRTRKGITRTDVEEKLREWSTSAPHESLLKVAVDKQGLNAIDPEVSKIPKLSPKPIELLKSDLAIIANAYGISRLMLGPLLALPSKRSCVVLSDSEFEQIDNYPGGKTLGNYAVYRFPKERLAKTGTDSAESFSNVHIVDVVLPASKGPKRELSQSDKHWHPGDELVYVTSGCVEFRLLDSGMMTRLEENEFIHFYAEQRHGAWNPSSKKPARMIVLRFYEYESSGLRTRALEYLESAIELVALNQSRQKRQELVEDLQQEIDLTQADAKRDDSRADRTKHDKVPLADLWKSIHELEHSLNPFPLGANQTEPQDVQDAYGFAELLTLLKGGKFQKTRADLSFKQIAKQSGPAGARLTPADVYRALHGELAVDKAGLLKLAVAFGVPGFLFADFLYPAIRGAVAIHAGDWPDVTREFTTGENVGKQGGSYSVPSRRLRGSNVGIARIRLKKGETSLWNRHPGHELLLPIQGSVSIRRKDPKDPDEERKSVLDKKRHTCAHFGSDEEHLLINDGNETAELLVIRFYGTSTATSGPNSAQD